MLCPDWELRYFSFDPAWATDEQMASMRNGSGDEYSIVFTPSGVYIRGFDHESPLSPWAQQPPQVVLGLTERVPPSLRLQVAEPAFTLGDIPAITVCLWRESSSPVWHYGAPVDPGLDGEDGGASWLFQELDGNPSSYVSFAAEYFEVELEPADVEAIFRHTPLQSELVERLNGEADLSLVYDEVSALGYPVGL